MKRPFLFSSLLFFVPMSFTTLALAENENLQAGISIEYVNSCKGLSEKDSCQVHGKTNNLVNGTCRTKAIAADNFDLVCVPEQPNKNRSAASDTSSDQGDHQPKRKHR